VDKRQKVILSGNYVYDSEGTKVDPERNTS